MTKPDAPRLRFYWGRVEECTILTMPRTEWDTLHVELEKPVLIDVAQTPMAQVAYAATVIGALARGTGPATATVSIFRHDPKDPKPYNQDEYDVWTDLTQHPQLARLVVAASTFDNKNFRDFCRDNVLFLKRQPGPDHWLDQDQLPASLTLVVRST